MKWSKLCWRFIRAPARRFHLNLHTSTSDRRESRQLEAVFQLFDSRVRATHFHIFFPLLILIFLLVISCLTVIPTVVAVFIGRLLLASVGKATPPPVVTRTAGRAAVARLGICPSSEKFSISVSVVGPCWVELEESLCDAM